jgi:hypothetical protein
MSRNKAQASDKGFRALRLRDGEGFKAWGMGNERAYPEKRSGSEGWKQASLTAARCPRSTETGSGGGRRRGLLGLVMAMADWPASHSEHRRPEARGMSAAVGSGPGRALGWWRRSSGRLAWRPERRALRVEARRVRQAAPVAGATTRLVPKLGGNEDAQWPFGSPNPTKLAFPGPRGRNLNGIWNQRPPVSFNTDKESSTSYFKAAASSTLEECVRNFFR